MELKTFYPKPMYFTSPNFKLIFNDEEIRKFQVIVSYFLSNTEGVEVFSESWDFADKAYRFIKRNYDDNV